MNENPLPKPEPLPVDPAAQRLKERITATIALAVVFGTASLAVVATRNLTNEYAFARVKDLLLFMNPILGYVIGHYFSKTVTDKSVDLAGQKADAAEAKTRAVKGTLRDVIDAGRAVLGQGAPHRMVQEEAHAADARSPEAIRLWSTLEQAENVMNL